jgi:Ser-Thr-rich glycosyl-phosphatidyl-inositol-anchored membrane family
MQLTLSVPAFLALVASTLALQVTAPAEMSNLDLSVDNTISWASVSSDPDSFNIVLTNMNVNPPVRINIASNVDTSSGSYDFSGVEGATPGGNYRINLEGTESSNQGILAQSGQFTVAAVGASSTSSASFSSSTPSTSGMASSTCSAISPLIAAAGLTNALCLS